MRSRGLRGSACWSNPGRLGAGPARLWRLAMRRPKNWGSDCAAVPFGHALLEKLVQPYKSVTAHAWVVPLTPHQAAGPSLLDAMLAESLVGAARAGALRGGRSFAPLPGMGTPGWWDDNAEPGFYTDTAVYRPGRRAG